jgi:hypothetical protein
LQKGDADDPAQTSAVEREYSLRSAVEGHVDPV